MRTFFVRTILIFCSSVIAFGQKYEKEFYNENNFKNPAAIPVQALNFLRKDGDVQKCSAKKRHYEFLEKKCWK